MQERQDILEKTIGYLDMEKEALEKGYLILVIAIIVIVFGTLMELFFFCLYNGLCHPFASILKCAGETEDSILQDALSISRKLNNVANGCILDSDVPKEPCSKDEQRCTMLKPVSEFHFISKMEDVITVQRKINHVRDGCLLFSDQPKYH